MFSTMVSCLLRPGGASDLLVEAMEVLLLSSTLGFTRCQHYIFLLLVVIVVVIIITVLTLMQVMYLYYFLSAFGPKMQPFLWWKKYLTRLQMIQFVCVFIHALLPLSFDCGYPKIMPKILIANAAVFFILFSNFYFFAYIKKKSAPKEIKVELKEKSL